EGDDRPPSRPGAVMFRSSTVIIVRAELRAWRNRLARRGRARLVLLAVFGAVAAVTVGGSVFSLGLVSGHFLPAARDPLLAGGFTALSVLMLVVGFPTVIATLFVGRDLLQLALAPIHPFQIFLARGLIAMSANMLISGILVAAVVGIGVGAGAPPVYYLLTVVLVFAQVMTVTALQATLMALVLRWVPARIARDVSAAVAGLSGAGFTLLWNASLRQSFTSRRGADAASVASSIASIDRLPSAWPGHALTATISGAAPAAAGWTLLVLGLGAVLVVIAGTLYRRTLLAGLGMFGGVPASWRRGNVEPQRGRSAQGGGSPARAIARKDWLGYRRDIRRLARLLPAILFPIGYAVTFLRPSGGGNSFWSEVFLVSFIAMFMSTALATPSIPSERRGFQLLRMSPLSMWQVIRAKIVLTLPPVILLSVAFSIVLGLAGRNGAGQVFELAGLVVWLALGFVAVGVSAGAIDPHFESTDDRRSVGLVGTLAGVAGALGFGVLSVGAFALLLLTPGALAGTGQIGPIPATPPIAALLALAALILAAGAAAVVGLLLWIANARLRKFEAAISTS
ncbi:MAG TPA: hypothetical protein VEW68_06575, partial [Patescibacteria group bacterium]|nr:hypothetical protein [Patescibacteria group bacterium]